MGKMITKILKSVDEKITVDKGVYKFFPMQRAVVEPYIEYDFRSTQGTTVEFRSFLESAIVIEKNGHKTLRLPTLTFSLSTPFTVLDATAKKFGQTIYDNNGGINAAGFRDAAENATFQMKQNKEVTTKAALYEALQTHRIVGGERTKDGIADIVFPVPAANKSANDGTTYKYWGDAGADPIADIYRVWSGMTTKADNIIMNTSDYALFEPFTRTADDNTSGKRRNFVLNDSPIAARGLQFKGTLTHLDMTIEISIESDSYPTVSGKEDYCKAKTIVFLDSGSGELHHGGVPGKGGRMVAREEIMVTGEQVDPAGTSLYYRSAPLPLLKNHDGFAALTVRA